MLGSARARPARAPDRPRRRPDLQARVAAARLVGARQARRRHSSRRCSSTRKSATTRSRSSSRATCSNRASANSPATARSCTTPSSPSATATWPRACAKRHRASGAREVLAVVGAGHLQGLARHLREETRRPAATSASELESRPKKKSSIPWFTIDRWRSFVLGGFAWGFWRGGLDVGADLLLHWVLTTGVLGAIGCAARRRPSAEHPGGLHRLADHAAASGAGLGHGQRARRSVGAQADLRRLHGAARRRADACAAGGATASRACC